MRPVFTDTQCRVYFVLLVTWFVASCWDLVTLHWIWTLILKREKRTPNIGAKLHERQTQRESNIRKICLSVRPAKHNLPATRIDYAAEMVSEARV